MKKTTYLKSLLLIIAIAFSSVALYAQATTLFDFSGTSGYLAPPATGWTVEGTVAGGSYLKLNPGSVISPEYAPATNVTFKYDLAAFGIGSSTVTKLYILKSSDNSVISEHTLETANSSTYLKNKTVTIASIASNFKIKITAEGDGVNNSSIRATRLQNYSLEATSSSSCTASNLAFAEAIVNKIVGDGMFTQLATGLNATTAITYESDNAAVASVNETTGEVTVVAAGTATITATQAAGTHSAVDYCAATAEYTINVITTAPTITVTEVLPTMTTNLTTTAQQTLTVGAANLTADITMTISGTDAALFGVTSTLPATGGVITVTYTPTTVGTHSATLQINSPGATEVLVALNGSAIDLNGAGTQMNPYTVMDVKTLNNSLGTTNKYWVEGYIVGTPSGGNGTDLTTVDFVAPFSESALALAPTSNETDLSNMIAVQLVFGSAVRDALNLVANPTLLTRKVKVYGTLEGYFSGTPGVKNTSDYELVAPNSDVSATVQSLRRVGNQLVFDATAQQTVTVFNAVGQRLMSTTTIEGTNAITVNAKGLVFVRIDKQTVKVVF